MSVFERVVLRRFLATSGGIVLVLAWVAAAFQAHRLGKTSLGELSGKDILQALSAFAVSLEVIVVMGPSLGIVSTLSHMKRSGQLTAFAGRRTGVKSIRRVILVAAACSALASGMAYEMTLYLREMNRFPDEGNLWRRGSLTAWTLDTALPTGDLGGILVFNDDTLAVLRAQRAVWSDSKGAFVPEDGSLLFRGVDGRARVLAGGVELMPPPSLEWTARPRGAAGFIITLNQGAASGSLLVIMACLVFLIPAFRHWTLYAAFLLIVPLVGVMTIVCSVGFLTESSYALLNEIVWIGGLLGVAGTLDRIVCKRGLRL